MAFRNLKTCRHSEIKQTSPSTKQDFSGEALGSLSNHDERDDDDVKYTRRDWDENVAFRGKMKLKVAQNSFQH